MICCHPLDVQNDLVSANETEAGDTDLIVHEEVPSTIDRVIEKFSRIWKNSSRLTM